MESSDQPQAFGQHINAEITSQILDSNQLLHDIVALQPQKPSSQGESREEKVLNLISDLKENLPELIDFYEIKHKYRNDESPLKVVLLQELQRYSVLITVLHTTLD